MIFNTHSHLNDDSFLETEEVIIESCYEKKIKLLVVGYNYDTSIKALELSRKYDNVYVAIGLHPNESDDYELKLQNLLPLMKDEKVVAIGECGLDYHWESTDKEVQKLSFVAQIKIAQQLKKPLIVHMRDASNDTLQLLRKSDAKSVGGVMHCYSGSVEMVQQFISENFYISIAGPVTFKNAVTIKKVAVEVPLNKLLIETDDPWLAPMPHRGKQNRADYVVYVGKTIAKLRNISELDLFRQTYNNALKLFKIGG